MLNTAKLEQLIPMVQERAERLSDLLPLVDYLLGNLPELSEAHFEHKSMERGDVLRVLHHTLAAFDEMRDWQRDDLFALCQEMANVMELKFRDFLFPLFIATSGKGYRCRSLIPGCFWARTSVAPDSERRWNC